MGKSRDARRRAKEAPTKPVLQTITKKIGGEKNGGERTVIVNKGPKWYPADDIKKPVPSRKHAHKPPKLRSSIKPGSVLILLAGRLQGCRVIFLKQLKSGMLLVTGPYSVNRIPLRRVNQAYVIATSTSVDVSAVDVSKFDDAYFKRVKAKKNADVMETDEEAAKYAPTEERIADQKAVDQVLVPVIEKEPLMTSYLKNRFTLRRGMNPHVMSF
ncbi:60S ribosomal protein L6 [Gracilariopsis chorda]|uniref:60S ribosomal protein L6 n=1 Tax=Gracilariopsis chorda TaxID=448386 RepID=A0A2V3INT1_9FLOR|nr:60S ribosomal protein L6 [Gracilariopsis chorda]|eukprot:PXF43724.1 60S ribosomal protein L6 [Gracilariopsis chorda]